MTTVKATLHIFKKVLDESAERQQRLTSLYEALWDTLRGELDDTPDEPNNKRAKSDNDVNELLGVLQSSLLSMITSARNDLTILEPKAVEELRDSGKSALSVLEENDPATACRTRAEGLVLQAYMDRGSQLEAEMHACRRRFAEVAALHDAGRTLTVEEKSPERDVRSRLQT